MHELTLAPFLQESLKFMRHGRRTRLKVEDVDYALKVRNIEVSAPGTSLSKVRTR